jgi:hypothetical protein
VTRTYFRHSNDPTDDQVRRQLSSFGSARYEIGLIPPKHRRDLPRESIRVWTAEEILDRLGFLKAKNSGDYDVYIRPAAVDEIDEVAPLVFIDDLSAGACKSLVEEGFRFGVLIESSPGNFHGWVRLGEEPIPKAIATEAAKMLAARFGGDPASADWRHWGRLAGFTNRKASRRTAGGLPPFARLTSACTEVSPAGAELLDWANVVNLERVEIEARRRRRVKTSENDSYRPKAGARDPILAFVDARSRLGKVGAEGKPDDSATDLSACLSMLRRGFSVDDVARALETSPSLAARHSDPADYIRRTVEAAVRIVRPKSDNRRDVWEASSAIRAALASRETNRAIAKALRIARGGYRFRRQRP